MPSGGRSNRCRLFGAKRRRGWIRTARHVNRCGWVRWIDPRDVPSTLNAAQSDPHRDPGEPGSEGALTSPSCEALERGHEGLLRCVLGLMDVTEDPVTRANDTRRLAVDEHAERLAVAGEDGVDDDPVVVDEISSCVGNSR